MQDNFNGGDSLGINIFILLTINIESQTLITNLSSVILVCEVAHWVMEMLVCERNPRERIILCRGDTASGSYTRVVIPSHMIEYDVHVDSVK